MKYNIPELPTQQIVAILELISKYPQLTQMYPFLMVEGARDNDRRNAYVKLLVQDDVVKNIKGKDKPDNYALIRLGRKIQDFEQSGLILPPGIV